MEAAHALPISRPTVELRDGVVMIDGLVVEDRTLAELVERRLEQGTAADETVAQALEIGARVLDREATAAEVDFVKREFERASDEVERSFAERAAKVAEDLERRLEEFLGEDGGTVAKTLDSHADELAELIARHFGADRNTAVQHQVQEMLAKKLQEQRQDLLKQFSAADGHNPLADFKASVVRELKNSGERHEALIEKLAGLEGEISRLRDAREAEAELAAERERGASKGRSFEERAFALVEEMASARGDAAHHVGDERAASGGKSGDIVIELEAASGPVAGRIAIDAKDEKLSRNRAWQVLDSSLAERDAAFAILLVASEDKVPARSEQLHEYEGNKMIVTLDRETLDPQPLELAYRYARCRCLMAGERELQLDAAGVRDATAEALSALKDAQRVRSSLTGASNGVEGARKALDSMVARVQQSLDRVESLIA
jgi:hypothetical protein